MSKLLKAVFVFFVGRHCLLFAGPASAATGCGNRTKTWRAQVGAQVYGYARICAGYLGFLALGRLLCDEVTTTGLSTSKVDMSCAILDNRNRGGR